MGTLYNEEACACHDIDPNQQIGVYRIRIFCEKFLKLSRFGDKIFNM